MFRQRSHRSAILLFTALFSLLSTVAWAHTTIAPDNRQLQYTGRVDFTHLDAPQFSWPGTSLTANFSGKYLALVLDDQLGKNYFNVFIDDDFSHPVILECAQGEKTYVVATNLKPGTHKFLLTKRTEGEDGATTFKNIFLADEAKLLAPPSRPKHRMEIFGDSITSGMGNEAIDGGRDNDIKGKNNFMAYGPIAARNLDAEIHVISQSGIGIMISWFNFTMPQFYDQLNAVGNNDTKWDFAQWTPEVVVINLFQNDSWLIDLRKRLQPMPTDEQRVQAYKTFVKTIREKYPHAFIICALGSMDAVKKGSKWPGYISAAVKQMKQENPNEKMDTLFFDFTGYTAHPRVKQHQENAEKLTAFIKEKMGW